MSANHGGCQVTIHKEWEQTFRPALCKTDTANPHLAMPGLFSDLAWLNCLQPLLCLIGKPVLIFGLIQAGQRLANLPEYCAELNWLNLEHRERKTLLRYLN